MRVTQHRTSEVEPPPSAHLPHIDHHTQSHLHLAFPHSNFCIYSGIIYSSHSVAASYIKYITPRNIPPHSMMIYSPLTPTGLSSSTAPKFDSPSSPVWNSEKAHGLAFHNKYDELCELLKDPENHKLLLRGDFMRWTCLVFATQRNNLAIVRLILSFPEGRESIRMRTRGGNTVLHFCACSNAPEIMREVLRHKEGREIITVRNAQGFLPHDETKNSEIHFILKNELGMQKITRNLISDKIREKWSDMEVICGVPPEEDCS